MLISPKQAMKYCTDKRTDQALKRFGLSAHPIYQNNKKKSRNPEMIGSSFLFRVDGKYYLVTAVHVLDSNQQSPFGLYVGGSSILELITGNAITDGIKTKAPPSSNGDDKFDFACMESSDDFSKRLGINDFIDANDVYQNEEDLYGRCFLALGYPASQNKSKLSSTVKYHVCANLRNHTANAITDENIFSPPGASQNTHILLKYSKEHKTDTGKTLKSFKPHGASGGILVDLGIMYPLPHPLTAEFIPGLAGILIEYHNKLDVILVVKIQSIIEAIRKL